MISVRCVLALSAFAVCATVAVKIVENPCANQKLCREGPCDVVIHDDLTVEPFCPCLKRNTGAKCQQKISKHDWHETECRTSKDCIKGFSKRFAKAEKDGMPVCFKRLCLCPVGYFYSKGQNFCRKYCKASDLQKDFVRYPGAGLVPEDEPDFEFSGSANGCKKKCAKNANCENFRINGTECFGYSFSGGSKFGFQRDIAWDHYQRLCA